MQNRTQPTVQALDVMKSYPGTRKKAAVVPVLRGISLHVMPGEMVAIVGRSGSGKSTLLYCLSGLEPVTSGYVGLVGTDITRQSAVRQAVLRRDEIGFVFQSFNLIDSLTAWENVALPGRLARRRVNRNDIDRALDQVGLTDRGSHHPAEMSGGEQQRVAIARVLATGPRIVFADEPTGALDTTTGAQILRLLRASANGERSVVLVTHDLEAASRADRVLVLRDGLIHAELANPTPDAVFEAVRQTHAVETLS